MDADPFFVDEGDIEAAREIVESADDGEPSSTRRPALLRRQQPAELRRGATKLLTERVLAFLERVG